MSRTTLLGAGLLLGWLLAPAVAAAGPVSDRLATDGRLTWTGLDYRAVQQFVPEDLGSDPSQKVFWGPGADLIDYVGTFDSPRDAFVRLCTDWNQMFANAYVPRLQKRLKVQVKPAPADTCGNIQRADGDWFQPATLAASNPPTMDAAVVADAVRSWPDGLEQGLALVVVVERLAKDEAQACAWPAFYDAATRDVLYTARMCEEPAGLGYRNYWFNPIGKLTTRLIDEVREGQR